MNDKHTMVIKIYFHTLFKLKIILMFMCLDMIENYKKKYILDKPVAINATNVLHLNQSKHSQLSTTKKKY